MRERPPDGEARRDGHRIEPYLNRLFGYALSLTNHMEGARDLVQLCALKVLSAHSVPLEEAAYRAWLFRILRNAHFDQIRKEARTIRYVAFDDLKTEEKNWNNESPVDVFSVQQRFINELAVRDGICKLKSEHREIVTLIDMAGFSYQETADLLGIPLGTVMSRLSRARGALLNYLGGRRHVLPIRLRRGRSAN